MDYHPLVEEFLLNPHLGKRYPLYGSQGHIFVPPDVHLVEEVLPDARHSVPRNRCAERVPLLCYPVPSSWYETRNTPQSLGQGTTLLTAPCTEALAPQQWPSRAVRDGFTPEEHESFQAWKPVRHWWKRAVIDTQALAAIGWHWGDEDRKQHLLDEVLELAASEYFGAQCYADVAAFATKWGPLWICRTSDHGRCQLRDLWSWVGEGNACLWAPVEEVYAFWQFAWEVNAVLKIVESLCQGQIVSSDLSTRLRFCADGFAQYPTLDTQRDFLAMEVSLQLNQPRGGPSLEMAWEGQDTLRPSLHVSTPLGVRHTTWMQVAQVLCRAFSLGQCDKCGSPYVRRGRRPQRGRQQFCPECQGGRDAQGRLRNLGSKSLYARKRRAGA